MPYIITTYTTNPEQHGVSWPAFPTRRAVATLDEAKGAVIRELSSRIDSAFAWDLSLRGGTVGPLPDGTVIEVKPALVTPDLARAANIPRADWFHMSDTAILDAYNAAVR